MEAIPVTVIRDLVSRRRDDLSNEQMKQHLDLALQSAGYPTTTPSVATADANAILEELDAGPLPVIEPRTGADDGIDERPGHDGTLRVLGPPPPRPRPPRTRP